MKLGGGGRFAKLSSKVKQSEMKSGYNAKDATRIADATAAKIGRAKYGNKKMAQMAAKGRKR